MNRGGNRRLNAALYRIVLTQAHHHPEAKAYIERRVSEGKTKREAYRALRRFVARAIWRLWQECQQVPTANLGFAALSTCSDIRGIVIARFRAEDVLIYGPPERLPDDAEEGE